MGDIGSLVIKISADASSLAKEFDKMADSGRSFGDKLERAGSLAAKAFLGLSTAAAAMTVQAGRQAEELDNLSKITGVNTDTLQEYDVVLNRVGLTGTDMTAMMRTLSKNLEEARMGTGLAADRFRQLGIDITRVTDTNQLIRMVADSVSRFASGAEKAAAVSDLLGKSGLKFIPAFDGGAKALDAAAAASKRLGDTLSSSQVEVLTKMDDAIDDLGIAWKRFSQQLGAFLAPSVEFVVDLLKDMLAFGSTLFKELNLAADTLAIRFTHMALALGEISSVLFSSKLFDAEAWAQVATNIGIIDSEAAKLIAKAREAAAVQKKAQDDARAKPPQLVDSAKELEAQRRLADERLAINQQLFKNQDALAKASHQLYLAQLDAELDAGKKNEDEVMQAKMVAQQRMDAFTKEMLDRELANYQLHVEDKQKLFASDAKGQQDKLKFEAEATQKILALRGQMSVAAVQAQTNDVQGLQRFQAAHRKQLLEPLQDEIVIRKANADLAASFYQQDTYALGAAETARQRSFALLEAEGDLRRELINQTITDEERKVTHLLALEADLAIKRRGIVEEFPTIWEQQLNDIVKSNTFSMSLIVNSWTAGIAQGIVQWDNFTQTIKNVWQQTLTTMLQFVLNFLVQRAAKLALSAATEAGIVASSEAGKTAAVAAGAAARTGLTAAEAATEVGIMTGAQTSILGMFATVGGALKLMLLEDVVPAVTAVGTYIMGVLSAIADAMAGTIFGIPAAAVILAGVAAIGVAIAAGVGAFAKGGIVTGPTLGMIGEAGSSEAVIPLNSRGAGFMQKAFGGGAGGPQSQTITIELDGRTLAWAQFDEFISMLRMRGVPVGG